GGSTSLTASNSPLPASTIAPGSNWTPGTAPSTPTTNPTPTPTPTPAPTPTPTPTPTSGVPRSSHVVLVIEENHMFSEVFPNGMPWLVAQGNKYGYTTNYHANEPGSLLNYLWLSSGSGEQSFGCNGDNCGGSTPANGHPITDDNIFRRLTAAGLTWKVYAESLPSGIDPTTIYQSGAYVARHNPAVFYSDILTNSAQKQNIVPFTQFAKDLASNQLPAYSIIVPDVTHDAHDGS